MTARERNPDVPALSVLPGGRGDSTPDEVEPTAAVACPDHLAEPARTVWHELAPVLPHTLTPADAATFGLLCVAIATFREADELIRDSGIVISDAHGNLIENPLVKTRNTAEAQVSRWASRFGLTPVDRRQLPPSAAPSSPTTTGPRRLPHLVE